MLEEKMTYSNTIARIRLYKFAGGVPKGSHDKKTRNVATQSNGANPVKNAKMNLHHTGQSFGGVATLGPNCRMRAAASLVCSPSSMLQM